MALVPSAKPMRVALLAVAMLLAAATTVEAQDSTAPDLGQGWELRLEQPMHSSMVAGSAETGFLVRGWQGAGEDADVVALWSADGLEWQEVTDTIGRLAVFDLAANDSGFVAVRGDAIPTGSALFSPDGLTWQTVGFGTRADYWRVESGADGFLLVGGCDSEPRFSRDGRDWMPAEVPVGCNGLRAALTNSGWIGISERTVLSSDDGENWSGVDTVTPPPELPSPRRWPGYEEAWRTASLSSDGETLVLAGQGFGGGLWASTDLGVTWTRTGPQDGEVEMAVADFGFVGVAPQRVLASSDGLSWVEHRVDADFSDVAAVGSTVVAPARDGIYVWTAAPATLPNTGTTTMPALIVGAALIAMGATTLAMRRSSVGVS